MSDIHFTSAEAQRLGEEEAAVAENSKDFLTSSLRWTFALFGAKEFLMNKQATFIAFSIALIAIFAISSRTARSSRGTTFINFAFLMLGCLVVGIAIDSIILNSYIKWVIYGLFIALVAINPDYQQTFQEMQQIFKSICRATSRRLGNSFNQVQVAIQNHMKINDRNREDPSMTSNPATRPVGGDGGIVGEDNV